MILLTSTSDLLRVTTSSAATVKVHASHVDRSGATITPGRLNTAIASATTTTIVASPAASTDRTVKFVSIYNDDASLSVTVTVLHTDGTTAVDMWSATLAPQQGLQYDEGAGWSAPEAIYATAAQGTLAGTAVQPGANANVLGSGSATDNFVLTANGAGGAAWEAASGGGGSSVTDYLRTRLGTVQDLFNMADTWNASGTIFTGIKLNVTNTASASATVYNKTGSALFELQTNGDTKFWVGRDGGLWLKTGEGGGAGRSIAGIGSNGVENWKVEGNGGAQFNYLTVNDFLAATRLILSNDAILVRDAANTLAQRNGTNAQTKRIYGTYTDASNHRRLALSMTTGGVAEIKPEGAGTGLATANVLHISGLPTSNPGPGILWNNAGTPAIGT